MAARTPLTRKQLLLHPKRTKSSSERLCIHHNAPDVFLTMTFCVFIPWAFVAGRTVSPLVEVWLTVGRFVGSIVCGLALWFAGGGRGLVLFSLLRGVVVAFWFCGPSVGGLLVRGVAHGCSFISFLLVVAVAGVCSDWLFYSFMVCCFSCVFSRRSYCCIPMDSMHGRSQSRFS